MRKLQASRKSLFMKVSQDEVHVLPLHASDCVAFDSQGEVFRHRWSRAELD